MSIDGWYDAFGRGEQIEWWFDKNGDHPAYGTIITFEDMRSGKWTPYPLHNAAYDISNYLETLIKNMSHISDVDNSIPSLTKNQKIPYPYKVQLIDFITYEKICQLDFWMNKNNEHPSVGQLITVNEVYKDWFPVDKKLYDECLDFFKYGNDLNISYGELFRIIENYSGLNKNFLTLRFLYK